MSDDVVEFQMQRKSEIESMAKDSSYLEASNDWMKASSKHRYSYHFDWLGLPIIQYPQDIVAIQELIWRTKPSLIIETGVARGGSLVLSASILALLDLADGHSPKREQERCVVGVDIDIRPHNRKNIESHPISRYVRLLEGSSTDSKILDQIKEISNGHQSVMVFLDSNHTYDHVAAELSAYAEFVTPGSYLVVFDTIVNSLPKEMFLDRPWGPDNNPMIAVNEFLSSRNDFVADIEIDHKLGISVAPRGYLKKTSD
jgi:cephalosporin hydroxylase